MARTLQRLGKLVRLQAFEAWFQVPQAHELFTQLLEAAQGCEAALANLGLDPRALTNEAVVEAIYPVMDLLRATEELRDPSGKPALDGFPEVDRVIHDFSTGLQNGVRLIQPGQSTRKLNKQLDSLETLVTNFVEEFDPMLQYLEFEHEQGPAAQHA